MLTGFSAGRWQMMPKPGVIALLVLVCMPLLVVGCATEQAGKPVGEIVTDTPAGAIRGQNMGDVAVYRGIPYALPPEGARRWMPPQAVPDWEGERDALAFGPACPQPASLPGNIYATELGAVDEDCLSLNVWTPENAENAPVFVWIHGGSLTTGAGSLDMYDGARMAREQGLVVVTINYRLGVLGYLAHPGLSAESEQGISGNYGLMDQILALEWVKRNISAFGGDADNVTVAGESAGALSVVMLMTSPKAKGLFDKAIAESAYMVTMASLKEQRNGLPSAEATGEALARKMGAEDVDALRAMSADKLVNLSRKAGYFPFPVIDGVYETGQMVEVFDKGEQAPVPVLAGFNEGEIRSLRFLLPPIPKNTEAYEAAIRNGYGELSDRYLEIYPSDNLEASMLAATRDAMYGWTAERLAASQTAYGHPSFFYLFDHSYPAADRLGLRAFHASEIPYVFGTMKKAVAPWPEIPDTEEERALSEDMMQYWASFARDGQPVADGAPEWPAYGNTGTGMVFAEQPKTWDLLARERFDLHEEVVCRRRAAGNVPWNWNVGILSPPLPPKEAACE
ncbi:carboxylesterase type B [Hyphomonas adhaerens MHS-3]|uniref:Carboxylic ester hydrolase n=2 Tax=Hyphomonas adhaerens TaxID=81029 RepID=A0A069E7I5_9PROT|nr:carboxylesterase type B [Hyphomonas adhaerens MHS-3]